MSNKIKLSKEKREELAAEIKAYFFRNGMRNWEIWLSVSFWTL